MSLLCIKSLVVSHNLCDEGNSASWQSRPFMISFPRPVQHHLSFHFLSTLISSGHPPYHSPISMWVFVDLWTSWGPFHTLALLHILFSLPGIWAPTTLSNFAISFIIFRTHLLWDAFHLSGSSYASHLCGLSSCTSFYNFRCIAL